MGRIREDVRPLLADSGLQKPFKPKTKEGAHLVGLSYVRGTPGEIVSGPAYAVRTSLALLGTANTYGVGVLRERCSLVELPTPWFVGA